VKIAAAVVPQFVKASSEHEGKEAANAASEGSLTNVEFKRR
jgi:hypothetical protein